MKRIISALAMLAVFAAAPVLAQTSTDTTYGTEPMNQTTPADPDPATTDADRTMDDTSTLPATAGPLPLMAAFGIAAIGIGAWMSRRRRKA